MSSLEKFKSEIKELRRLKDKGGLSDYGIVRLEALDEYENLILFGVIKPFNAIFKKYDKVIYGTNIEAIVVEELENNIVHIDIRNFGKIKVKKQDLRLATESI
jgi:hypothetical protein